VSHKKGRIVIKSFVLILIFIGSVGIATAGAIPVDPGLVYVSVGTSGDYSPVIVSAVDPGLFSSPIVQPSFIPDLSKQWYQTPAVAPEPTPDTNPVFLDETSSIPVKIPPFDPVPAPLPVLALSMLDTPGHIFPASDIVVPSNTLLIPDDESGTFSPLIWGGAAVGPMMITGDRGTTNWAISVAFDRSVTIEEAYAIVEKHHIPDGYRILIQDTPRNNPPDSVTFWIDYNCEQPDSVAKTIVDSLMKDSRVKYITILYGIWA
jgi:hypothetical protein